MSAFGKKWSGDSQLWWAPAQPGGSLELPIIAAESAEYRLVAQFTKAPDYGIFDLYLNDAPILQGLDLYYNKVEVTGETDLGVHKLKAGTNVIKVVHTGKNPMAISKFMFGLDYIKTVKIK